MTPWLRRLLPPLCGGLLLMLLAHRFGAEPFRRALAAIDVPLVLVAVAVTALTTACSAQRWRLVVRHEHPPGFGDAVRAYYRSQFLNTTLPAGVLGDAHRAWRHGVRAVVVERTLGQVVQVLLGVLLLVLLPTPVRALALLGGAVLLLAALRWPGAVALSLLAAAGHLGLFLLVAHASGVDLPWPAALPLGVLVLVASALPLNLVGWGPREGAAAWLFGAAGLTTAVVYGALVLLATLPGAVLLLLDTRRRSVR